MTVCDAALPTHGLPSGADTALGGHLDASR